MRSKLFRVVPRIPDELADLKKIAGNTWWSWNRSAVRLFRSMDTDLWEATSHNPTLLLGRVSQNVFGNWSPIRDSWRPGDVSSSMEEYLSRATWFRKDFHGKLNEGEVIAYFSAEFGLHESLPIYSGGLGILAGDTMKSASDLGLPLVGVSLLYRLGYFNQYLNSDGWQQERYSVNDYSNMPAERVLDTDGTPITIMVPMDGERVLAAIWQIRWQGKLFLLDTNLPENSPENREITSQLYGGDKECDAPGNTAGSRWNNGPQGNGTDPRSEAHQ